MGSAAIQLVKAGNLRHGLSAQRTLTSMRNGLSRLALSRRRQAVAEGRMIGLLE